MQAIVTRAVAIALAVIAWASWSAAANAADFDVVIAKGIESPVGLQRGGAIDHGQRVKLTQGGLLILRETAGCRQHLVYSGQIEDTVMASAYIGCAPARDIDDIRPQVQQGQSLAERVVLRFEGKADGYDPLAGLTDPCLTLLPMSEEHGRNTRQCPSGYLLAGIRCSGPYCDDKVLRCCPYLGGQPDGTESGNPSTWISEETGPGRQNLFTTPGFINGLTCRGSYCDDLFPHAVRAARFRNVGACNWTPLFSEEPPSEAHCPEGAFVAGMQCQ